MKSPREFLFSFRHVIKPLTQRMIGRRAIRGWEAVAYILAFTLAVVAVGVFLHWHIASLYEQEMASWRTRQSSVADDQTQRVSDWLRERQADTQLIATLSSVRIALRAYYHAGQFPEHPSAAVPELTAVLDEMARLYSYAGVVYVLDRDARIVAQSSRSSSLDPLLIETCRAVARSAALRIEVVGDAPDRSRISFSAPVFPGPPVADTGQPFVQPLGVVLVVLDPSQTFFPLVARESFPTRSGETLLVRREGNDIVYFSPLRFAPAGSQHLRFPLSAAPIPARLALEGRETFVDYNDYRGVPVLATTRHIPLTGWGLVRKVDRTEAMEDFRRMAITEELAAGLLIILLGGLLLYHRREVITRGLKQEEEKFRMLLEWAPDAIYILEPSTLRILRRNRKAAEMDGYSDEDLTYMTAADLYPPEYHTLLRERFEKGLETGRTFPIQTLHHRRKNGQLVSVEESQSLVEAGGERLVLSIVRDISARKDAEKHLVQMEARYRGLLEAAPDAMVVVNQGGEIVLVNLQAEKQFGYRRDELVGKNVKSIIPEGFAERLLADALRSAEDALAQQIGTGIELTGRRTNGNDFPIEIMLSPLKSDEGILVTAAIRDITERKRAEEALVEERHLLYTLMDNLPALIYFKDRESHFTRINKAHAKLFGLSDPAQAVGKSDFDFFTAEHAQEAYRDEQEIIRTGQPLVDREEKETWSDGRVTWASITKMPLRDANGNIIGTFGVSRDITERKRAEAEHVRLVTAIEQSAEAVVITKTTGDIEYVNPAFTRITGYSCEEVLGQNPRILKSGKQDLAFYQQLWATILKGEIWHGEVINRKKDGSLYTEAMNIAPVRNPAGEVVNFIATKQDVTKRKSMEAQLLQAAKMEAIGRLAGGVAHDFNNLLTIISGYGHLLQERLSPQDLGHVEEILKASDRAAALTRQLLAFSRRQILAPQVLDLNSLVANLEKMLRRLIGEDIELTTVQQSGLGRVKADPGQIEQVIINLAVNARDAMPQGGKLTIETANVKLDETYARSHAGITPGPHVMLAVSDTGLGMDPETLGSIFEPFFTTKEKGKGTGLGLATVYGIVKQSAGSIWVYSEPGQGTTCKIYFPCIEEPMPEAEPARVRAELAKGSETILVVEDEEGVRSLVCETLKSKGYNVLDARGPSEALTIVEHYVEPIHMLLTDVVMPQMSGKELAKRLSTVRPGAKVLYMSGYTDDAIVRHGVLEAGTFFLQKPFVPSILLRKVREVLDTKLGDQR